MDRSREILNNVFKMVESMSGEEYLGLYEKVKKRKYPAIFTPGDSSEARKFVSALVIRKGGGNAVRIKMAPGVLAAVYSKPLRFEKRFGRISSSFNKRNVRHDIVSEED
jgi:hypothetical protein